MSRDEAGELIGYQRDEVKNHVDEIVEYLNEDDILFPNSIIIALSSAVRFKSSAGSQANEHGRVRHSRSIRDSLCRRLGRAKPGWIVDGQQRALALSKSKRHDFSVPVNAFVTDEVDLQRDQFLRINNAKPLPRGLVTELLPEVDTTLPPRLAARRIPSHLCDLMNRQEGSPFHGLDQTCVYSLRGETLRRHHGHLRDQRPPGESRHAVGLSLPLPEPRDR